MQRHRRHCNPDKVVSKRKSCGPCVHARSKCCLSQPTCSRCSERRLFCEYAAPHDRSTASKHAALATNSLPYTGDPHDFGLEFASDVAIGNAGWNTDMSNSFWTSQVNVWPSLNLEQTDSRFDLSASSTADLGATGDTQEDMNRTAPLDWRTRQWNATSPSPSAPILNTATPAISELPLSISTTYVVSDISSVMSPPSLDVAEIIRNLRTYPTCLSSDDYHTPLLHREMYGTPAGAITQLPKSTTAVMCALGLNESSKKSFLQRALTAERQRLIEEFVSTPRLRDGGVD